MTELLINLTDDPVMVMWFVMCGCFFFLALFTLRVWLDVKGIRGLAITTLMLSCGLLAMLLGVARSPDARLPWQLILVGMRPLFLLMLFSAAVLCDLWAADHNEHRSATTIIYQFWKRMTAETDKQRGRRERYEARRHDETSVSAQKGI